MLKTLRLLKHILIILVILAVFVLLLTDSTNATITNNIVASPVEKEGYLDNVVDVQEGQIIEKEELDEKKAKNTEKKEEDIEKTETLAITKEESHKTNLHTVITVENISDEIAKDVVVLVPILNETFYQNITWEANYPTIQLDNSIATFELGEIQPHQKKTLVVNYNLEIHKFMLEGDNTEINHIRKIYDTFPNSGNCLNLHHNLKDHLTKEGFQTRIVYGYARPEYKNITPGSLEGVRHSWIEIYVDDVDKWLPVDLNFGYFMDLPYASHITEAYEPLPTQVNFTGGELQAHLKKLIL